MVFAGCTKRITNFINFNFNIMIQYKKLNWLQNGNIRLTQSGHAPQIGKDGQPKAIDVDKVDLTAPERLEITRIVKDKNNPYNSYTEFDIIGASGRCYLQIVHFEPFKSERRIIEKGEVLGYCTADHYHITLNVVGNWENILDFTNRDRNIDLTPLSAWRGFEYFADWNTYGDRSIGFVVEDQPAPVIPQPEQPVQKTYVIQGSRQLWRSQAIQQIINAGLLTGNWQQYDQEFNRLNPIPQGGYKPGQTVILP